MVRFSFEWTAKDIKASSKLGGQYFTYFKLSNECIIVCFWKEYLGRSLKPHSLQIRRVSTTYSACISGIISFKSSNSQHVVPSRLTFSEFWKSGYLNAAIKMDVRPFEAFTEYHNLSCDINILSFHGTSGNEECEKCVHLGRLFSDFSRLLEQDSYSPNVNLKCGNASIPAHKSILSVRSPVFASMFKNPVKENLENEVVITDMDESVLRLMLTYIYKGHVSDLTVSTASDLLFAADKYQLEDLKKVCCEFLKKNISLQNVLRIASFGDMLCNDLKSNAIDYICNSLTDVSVFEETYEWKTMKHERPYLIIDILTSLVKTKENMERLYESNTV